MMDVNIQKNHVEAEMNRDSIKGEMKKKMGAIGKVFDRRVLEINWISEKSIP